MNGLRAYQAAAIARIRLRPREEVFAQLKWIAEAHGFKRGWVAYKFREVWTSWPNRMDHIAAELPSVELQEWVYRDRELRAAELSREKARLKRLTPTESLNGPPNESEPS